MDRTVRLASQSRDCVHVEASNCIVNIYSGLHDAEGRAVTSVEVLADYLPGGRPVLIEWPVGASPEGASFRVVTQETAVERGLREPR